eukprot:1087462-Pyramimonas_sp.AAC.1
MSGVVPRRSAVSRTTSRSRSIVTFAVLSVLLCPLLAQPRPRKGTGLMGHRGRRTPSPRFRCSIPLSFP